MNLKFCIPISSIVVCNFSHAVKIRNQRGIKKTNEGVKKRTFCEIDCTQIPKDKKRTRRQRLDCDRDNCRVEVNSLQIRPEVGVKE